MPTPSSKKQRKRRYVYKWLGHIEVYFNDTERDEAIAHIGPTKADFEDILSRITQQGIGVKFSYSGSHDDYRITLQPKQEGHPYDGYTVGYSHVELSRLLLIGQFIVEVLMADGRLSLPNSGVKNEW